MDPPDKVIKSRADFVDWYSTPTQLKENWHSLLILAYGHQNATCIYQLLGKDIKELYKHELKRLESLQDIKFDCLLKNKRVTGELLKKKGIYNHLSYGDDWVELVQNDTKTYLLANATPQQTAKYLELYHFKWVKDLVDDIQKRLNQAIQRITEGMFNPDDIEEELLYKSAAIIWLEKSKTKSISYAEMFAKWASTNQNAYIKTTSLFYKLFLEGKKLAPPDSLEENFLQYRLKDTNYFLFDHPESLLPDGQFMNSVANKVFEGSEQARQDACFYMHKLHEFFDRNTHEFDFKLALRALKSLELDIEGRLYRFLHTQLHYFRCLSILSVHIGLRIFLFTALYKMRHDLQKWDYPIKGTYLLQKLIVTSSLCDTIHKYFAIPRLWGEIFLNFIDSDGKYRFNVVDLFMSHLELVSIMEEHITKQRLPLHLVISFMKNLPAKKALRKVLDEFINLDKKNVKINEDNFHEMFLEAFNGLDNDPLLKKNMKQLSHVLFYSVCKGYKSWASTKIMIDDKDKRKVDPDLKEFLENLWDLPLEKSLFLLDAWILDQSSDNYNTLHARLHGINAVEYLRCNTLEKNQVYQDILAIPLKQRKAFDNRIIEKHTLRVGVTFDTLKKLDEWTDISPQERGEIYLQIVQTKSKDIDTICRSYFTLTKHYELFEEIEKILMVPLPSEWKANFIFFRLVKDIVTHEKEAKIFSILKEFEAIQNRVREDGFIPLFEKISNLKKRFTDEFEDPSLIFEFESERQTLFKKNVQDLANLLGLACFPPSALSVKQTEAAFLPLHPHVPYGPLRMSFWIPDPKNGNWNYMVILKKEAVSYFFLIPLKIPQNEQKYYFESIEEALLELQEKSPSLTIFSTFAKTLMENFTKGYFHLFHPKEMPHTTLLQNEKGITVKSKYLDGIAKEELNSEELKKPINDLKGYFSLRFTSLKGKEISQEIYYEKNKNEITLKIHSESITMEYKKDSLLYQATLLFLLARELEPVRMIKGMEEILMMPMPSQITNELLSFQPQKNHQLFSILQEFKKIQNTVKTKLFSSLVKESIFEALKLASEKLLNECCIPSKTLLAELLEFASCPPSFSIHKNDSSNSFVPLHPKLHSGPLKLTRSFQNHYKGNKTFCMIVKREAISCLITIQDGTSNIDFENTFNDHLTMGFYHLFDQKNEVPFSTIHETNTKFLCFFKGNDLTIKKEDHTNLITLKKTPKGKFNFYSWIPKDNMESRTPTPFYIEWKEDEKCSQITLCSSKNQTPENSLTLIHPLYESDQEWMNAVLYQTILLYFQLKTLV